MMPQIVLLLISNCPFPGGSLNRHCHCQCGQLLQRTVRGSGAGDTYREDWLHGLIKVETYCLPSWSLHLERTLWPWATKSKSQGWRIKPTHIPECGFVWPQGADITEQCLTFRFPKSLGCFVYFLRVLIFCPLCGFQHRKENLKQQNKQRKPIVSEKIQPLLSRIVHVIFYRRSLQFQSSFGQSKNPPCVQQQHQRCPSCWQLQKTQPSFVFLEYSFGFCYKKCSVAWI